MGNAAPVVGRSGVFLAVEILGGEHVPQPEAGLQPSVLLTGDAAGDQRLRIDLRASRGNEPQSMFEIFSI